MTECPAPPLPKSVYTEKGKKAVVLVTLDLRKAVLKTAAPIARDLEAQARVGSADPGGPI